MRAQEAAPRELLSAPPVVEAGVVELSHFKTKEIIVLSDGMVIGKEYGHKGKGFSRRHCRLLMRGTHTYIQDLNSTHGTYLNGVKLDPGVFFPLQHNDKLQIGGEGFFVRGSDHTNPPGEVAVLAAKTPEDKARKMSRMRAVEVAETEARSQRRVASWANEENLPPAMFMQRAFAVFIDGLFTNGVTKAAAMGLVAIGIDESFLSAFHWWSWLPIYFVVSHLPMMIYGQTPGKIFLRLRTVRSEGWNHWEVFKREFLGKQLTLLILPGVIGGVIQGATKAPVAYVVLAVYWLAVAIGYFFSKQTFWDLWSDSKVVKMK